MQASERRRVGPAVWTLIVLGIGIGLGVLLTLVPHGPRPGPGPGPDPYAGIEALDVVLSAVSLACIVALILIYARTYAEMGAKFALGLVFVLAALLFQAILSSPLFLSFGHELGPFGPFGLGADALKAAAFGAFLYLSLQ